MSPVRNDSCGLKNDCKYSKCDGKILHGFVTYSQVIVQEGRESADFEWVRWETLNDFP